MSILSVAKEGFNRVQQFTQEVADDITDDLAFFIQYFSSPKIIGSCAPSMCFMGREMASQLKEDSLTERNILEIGSGTGSLTKYIIRNLRPGDHLDVIECIPELAAITRKVVEASGRADQVTVHVTTIEDFNSQGKKYHYIISALPLNIFPPKIVGDIYNKIENKLLRKDGTLTYLELMGLSIRKLMVRIFARKDYRNLCKTLNTKKNFMKDKIVKIKTIWFNVPPAFVTHVKRTTKG